MSGKSILVIEDYEDTLELIEYNLRDAGFDVVTAMDGQSGMDACLRVKPDLVVLDVMLPGIDGLEVCRQIKRNPELMEIPVVMLTAKSDEVDRIVGLELGAADYVVKPFSPRELILRIKNVLKLRYPDDSKDIPTLRFEGLVLDFESPSVEVDGEGVYFTSTELKLMEELVRHEGKVRSRDYLLDKVWDVNFDGYSRTIDTHVRRIRRKLGRYAECVETIRGIGYRFKRKI